MPYNLGVGATLLQLAALGWISGSISWDRPWLLSAFALAALPAVLSLRARRRGTATSVPSLLAQTLAIALLALAAAGPRIAAGGKSQLPYAVFQDASASVRGQSPKTLLWPAGLERVDYLFASDVSRPSTPTSASLPADQAADSNLSNVLRIAAAQAPHLAGAVVVTDGQWPDDWSPAAAALGRARLPLLIVPLDSPPPDARVSGLAARRQGDGGVRVKVSVQSNSPMRRRLTVSRRQPPAVLMDRELTLLPAGPVDISLDDSPGRGLAIYEARLSPGDAFGENDQAGQTVLPQTQRLAVIARDDAAGLAQAMRESLDLDRADVFNAAGSPATVNGYLPYQAVVVVDATGQLLPYDSREALAEYVRNGGGLVLVGAGPYASPADRDDPLNSVAALAANPYQRTPLALAVVLDSSGSMAEASASPGQTKFQLACQAVLALQKHLTPSDALVVISYSDSARTIYDSGSRPPDFQALGDALRAVAPQGPTQVLPALERAVGASPPKGKQGLVLLVSDLLTEGYDTSKPQLVRELAALEQSFRAGGWKLSIVATRAPLDAPEVRTALEELSQRLGAQMVRREGLAGIADVFEAFLSQARGEPIARGKFDVQFAPDALGLTDIRLPAVDQYILCAPQGSDAALGSVGGDPVLAIRQVSLGRSAALALPLPPSGNASLHNDERLLRLLGAMVNWARRPGDDGRFQLQTSPRPGGVLVRLEAADSDGPMNALDLSAQIRQGGTSQLVERPLLQTAPGVYECSLPSPAPGAWLTVAGGPKTLCSAAMEQTCAAEFAHIGADWDNLRKLAELTGGRIVRAADLEHLALTMRNSGLTPGWPYLLGAALSLMLLDWCASRLIRRS